MKFDLLLAAGVELAETPIWDERIKKWYWTDLFAGDLHLYDPVLGKDEIFKTGKLIGSAIPTSEPEIVLVAVEDGMWLLDKRTGLLEPLADPEPGNAANRYNDTRVDAVGRIFTSSVSKLYGSDAYRPDMPGTFYMIDTDRTIHTIVPGINQYNAIVWNKDNTKMFVVDTFNEQLLVFDYSLRIGPAGKSEVAVKFETQGMPDGMSIDAEDNLYVCHWTGRISVWDKDVKFVRELEFPVPYACCGGFGGADKKDFYVASSRFKYTSDELRQYPGAGGIFAMRNDIEGMLEHFYQIR